MAAENILGIHELNIQRARWMGMVGQEYPVLICAKCCFTDHGSGITDMYPIRSQPSQLGAFRSTDKAWRGPLRPPDRAAHPMTSAVPGSSRGLLPCAPPLSLPSTCSNDTGLLQFLQYAKPMPTRLSEHFCPLLLTPLGLFSTARSGHQCNSLQKPPLTTLNGFPVMLCILAASLQVSQFTYFIVNGLTILLPC